MVAPLQHEPNSAMQEDKGKGLADMTMQMDDEEVGSAVKRNRGVDMGPDGGDKKQRL